MPPNTVSVARPTKWGNPYPVRSSRRFHPKEPGSTPAQAVEAFRAWMAENLAANAFTRQALEELRGKNLACWCKPGAPCHADVLLELANR